MHGRYVGKAAVGDPTLELLGRGAPLDAREPLARREQIARLLRVVPPT